MALEEWKLRLTSAKVEVEVEAELGNKLDVIFYLKVKSLIIIINECRIASQSHIPLHV